MPRKPKTYPEGEETFLLTGTGAAKEKKRVCASDRQPFRWLRQEQCIQYYELPKDVPPVSSSRKVAEFMEKQLSPGDRGQEAFWVLCLDVRNRPIALSEPFLGGRTSNVIDRTIVLQGAILSGATSFIVAHNHPSGDTSPSDEDVALTGTLQKAAELVGLRLLDHIIFAGESQYFSFTDAGLLKP